MKLAKGLRDVAFATHPFVPDGECAIYAILDECGNVIRARDWEIAEFKTPNIACNQVGHWTVLTTFHEAIYFDDPADTSWFETCVYGDELTTEGEKLKAIANQPHQIKFELLAMLYAPTLKQALRNHARGMRLARKSPRK
jgi:hypothetical protein